MKNNNLYFMQLAYKKALISFLNNNVPVGAVITNKKEIILADNNTDSKKKEIFQHAEIKCLKKLNKYKKDKTTFFVYTTLVPCPMCAGTLYMENLNNIYIGSKSNNRLHNEVFSKIYTIKGQYLEKKCSEILKAFFSNKR